MTTTYGIVSDIHGNEPALNAVLNDMPSIDKLICLGDTVGYGPFPAECAQQINQQADLVLRGNHETYLTDPNKCRGNRGAYHGITYAREQLSEDTTEWLTSLPYHDEQTIHGTTCKFVHGHPDEANPFQYLSKQNAHDLITDVNEHEWHVVVAGHSHVQFEHRVTNPTPEMHNYLVVNPGSVGQPRDKDPDAAYGVLEFTPDSVFPEVTLNRVAYDVDRTVDAIATASLPNVSGERLRHGQHPKRRKTRRF